MNKNKMDRKKNVDIALGYNSLDQGEPSEYCKKLLDEYVKGNVQPKEMTQKLIEKHKVK